jgi:exosome complex component RRP46
MTETLSQINENDESIFSSLHCILSPISKATGSATFTLNESLCTCLVNGPSELRQQQDATSRLQVDITFQARPGTNTTNSTSTKDKLIEQWLETLVHSTVLTEHYPRSQLNIVMYEEQNLSGEATILACLCNTLCITMLDANLPMKYAFAAVPIVQHPTKGLLALPKTKDELASTTYFVFVFEITLNDILAMHASGEFDMKTLEQAATIAKPIAGQIFQFYRQELEKRLS